MSEEKQSLTEYRHGEPGGLRLSRLSVVLLAVAVILAGLLAYSLVEVRKNYRDLLSNMNAYVSLQQSATAMEETSEYLTECVRGFVATGERRYVEGYFEEVNVTQRRDRAVETLRAAGGQLSASYLEAAQELSVELEEVERYAMVLYMRGDDWSASRIPQELEGIVLTAEDLALSPEEQREKARSLVHRTDYEVRRSEIRSAVERCTDSLIRDVSEAQLRLSDRMNQMLWGDACYTVLILLLVFFILAVLWALILRPQKRILKNIQEQVPLPLEGAYEMQFISATYNDVYAENLHIREQLSYEASHDALTGLYNRRKFDAKRSLESARTMVLIDVDFFKQINDTYGHDVGDRVLKRVADSLVSHFRSDDVICRIGGDEFAIIMKNLPSQTQGQLEARFTGVMEELSKSQGEIPPVTISVGVAFSDRAKPSEDSLKDADVALYRVKQGGRNGIAFY